MKNLLGKKWIKIPVYFFTIAFALVGFFLTAAYFAIYFRFTDEAGAVDSNSRYMQNLSARYERSAAKDSLDIIAEKYDTYNRLVILKKYYPKNALNILNALEKNRDFPEAIRMLDAVDMVVDKSSEYYTSIQEYKRSRYSYAADRTFQNTFAWMNYSEWEDFKIAVAKDKKLIDSVAALTGVESRLIVSCLVGEQIRLFNSDREAYKKWIGPLKVLSVESKFSLGVTGIKELTAQKMENFLKDSTSIYYLGKEYEHLLDFKTTDIQQERFDRLTSFRNHFYSYMYAAVFLKQVKKQWERSGFPIDNRPEILATLFNVGYPQSVPKKDPRVGGSTIMVKEKPYTFGLIAYQFYYSGELFDLFPIHARKFDHVEI